MSAGSDDATPYQVYFYAAHKRATRGTIERSGVTSSTPGTTTANRFDNIAMSRFNQVLIHEDVGNNACLGRLWLYDLTQDEETSGIVDAWDTIGPGWWLLNMQSQNSLGGELVRGGQMMAVYIPQTVPTPGALALAGVAGVMAARRRRM